MNDESKTKKELNRQIKELGRQVADMEASEAQRKRTEEALRRSERRYRDLYDNLRDGSAAVDMNGKIIEFNSAFQKMLGYASDELYQLTYEDITPKEWHAMEAEIVENQVLKRGYSDLYEKEYRKKDGRIFPVELRTYFIQDEDGKAVGMWAVIRDATERKGAEEALRESEANYRLLFSAESDAIIIVDAKTKQIVDANEAALALYGFSREELIGLSATEISAEPEKSSAHIEMVATGKPSIVSPGPVHRLHKKKDGTVLSVEISSGVYRVKDRKLVCAIVRDVTERRRADEAIRGSEARYKGIFEHTKSGVAVYEAVNKAQDFIFVDFNRSGEKIEKIKKEEVVGKSILEVFPGVKDFGLFEVMQRVWASGRPEHHPVSLYKDKRIVGWRDNFVYKLPTGEVVAVYSDETERIQAEQALRKAHDELYNFSQELERKVQERTAELKEKSKQLVEAEKLAALGKMANKVAHELRNPLTVVGGFTRRLHEKTPDMDPKKKYLKIVLDQVKVLENKISELTKIDDGAQ
jgi:PAS domain S-box-containing protein